MNPSKTRRQITFLAARMMYERSESEYYRAKMKAARTVCQGWVKPGDLPSNAEIRDEIQLFARTQEGQARLDALLAMRCAAFRLMNDLEDFSPRLIGSVLTGHIREGSDIDIHVFSDSLSAITAQLDYLGLTYEVTRKQVRKQGESQVYRHIHVSGEFHFELTVYDASWKSHFFKSSITGKAIERATLKQLRQLLEQAYPDLDLEQEVAERGQQSIDRFQLFHALLLPLENVKQNPDYHPEGDALYHSLQVFDLACDELPYDEEFLLAALLHDVGKAIDPRDHVNAGLEALGGYITDRTRWLIEHHMIAHKIYDMSIGHRQKRRLQANDSYQELLLLSECDRNGRQRGVDVPELDDALETIRVLAFEH